MYRDLGTANVVTIITALVVGYFFLDPPWRWLILIPAAVVESLDIFIWLRWRKTRATSGAEGLTGAKAKVVSIEKPGQAMVKAKGTLWRGDFEGNVLEGDEVRIVAVDGIRLRIAPLQDASTEGRQPPS